MYKEIRDLFIYGSLIGVIGCSTGRDRRKEAKETTIDLMEARQKYALPRPRRVIIRPRRDVIYEERHHHHRTSPFRSFVYGNNLKVSPRKKHRSSSLERRLKRR
jgi:hypothetical protein